MDAAETLAMPVTMTPPWSGRFSTWLERRSHRTRGLIGRLIMAVFVVAAGLVVTGIARALSAFVGQ